jgi:hypothetical protein
LILIPNLSVAEVCGLSRDPALGGLSLLPCCFRVFFEGGLCFAADEAPLSLVDVLGRRACCWMCKIVEEVSFFLWWMSWLEGPVVAL